MESGESQNLVGEGKDSPQFPSGLSLIHKISNRPTVICEKIWKHELPSPMRGHPWEATHHSGALAPEHLRGATSAVGFGGAPMLPWTHMECFLRGGQLWLLSRLAQPVPGMEWGLTVTAEGKAPARPHTQCLPVREDSPISPLAFSHQQLLWKGTPAAWEKEIRAGGEGLKTGGKQGAVASDGNNNTWIWLNIYPKEVKF